jgi:hypothetical protein
MLLLVYRSQETYRRHSWEQIFVNDVGISSTQSSTILLNLKSLRDLGTQLRKQVNR